MTYVFVGIVVILIVLFLYMWNLAKVNQVLEHHLRFEEFPESFGEISIYFISDIHKRKVSTEMLEKVKGKAELVIIGGDLAEDGVPFSDIEENINKLKMIGPVYFVWGNNDYELDYHQLDATLLSLGVKILDNTAVIFESEKGDKLSLMGVDYCDGKRARLDLALKDSKAESFKILVSHCPGIIRKIDQEHGISLVLAGHTHGGQIRLFGLGRYKKGGFTSKQTTLMLTSNGYGTSLIPFRLGAKPETHLINISNKSSK